MKKYLIIIILAISTTAFSQNRIDPASVIDSFTPQSIFNFNANSSHFIKGWNWSSESSKLDEALLMNFNHTGIIPYYDIPGSGYNEEIPFLYANGQNWILAISQIANGDNNSSQTQAQALHYEPSLAVDTTDNFSPMSGDTNGAVFGFKYKHPDFLLDQNISHNFVLRKSVLSNILQDSVIVLDSVWADDELKEIVDMGNNRVNESEEHMAFNGYQWYLTLRIKPLEQIDNSNANDMVLTIRMPYKTIGIIERDTTLDSGFNFN